MFIVTSRECLAKLRRGIGLTSAAARFMAGNNIRAFHFTTVPRFRAQEVSASQPAGEANHQRHRRKGDVPIQGQPSLRRQEYRSSQHRILAGKRGGSLNISAVVNELR